MSSCLLQIDVGGQRGERRKWIPYFDDVQVIMFLAAISEYDQVLDEDKTTNRVEESINLFQNILRAGREFDEKVIILFLNKTDLLEQKIAQGNSPVSQYFSDYKGPDDDVDQVKSYFQQRFEDLCPERVRRKELFVSFTTAINKDNINTVYAAVENVFFKQIFKIMGIE